MKIDNDRRPPRDARPAPQISGNTRKFSIAWLLTAALAAILAGCGGRAGTTSSPAGGPAGKAMDEVKFRMSWLISSEYAGIIAAVHNGFYEKQGIHCTIEPGGVGLNSIQLVADGADQFGLAGGDSLLVARSRGIPVEAFATEFQGSPQVFFARKSSGITSPAQFPGHTVGIKPGKTAEIMYRALVGKLHLNPATITEVPVKASLQPFYAGKVDVWPGFIFDEAAEVQERGIPISIIRPADYGVVFYSDAIFTTDSMIQKNPDLVKRFLTATQQGWAWAAQHPDDALKLVLEDYRGLDSAHEKIRLQGSLGMIAGAPGSPVQLIGRMSSSVWTTTYTILQTQGLLQSRFPVNTAYTLRFLQ